jgi:hypothetical protein
MYDERGRPVNTDTRRINRDIIRSHNEVMLVIGVAEPENNNMDAQAELIRKHNQHDDLIGGWALRSARILETAGIWGVNGMRQRILVSIRFFFRAL